MAANMTERSGGITMRLMKPPRIGLLLLAGALLGAAQAAPEASPAASEASATSAASGSASAVFQASTAEAPAPSPSRVKADYLYKFLSYVDFPPTALASSDTPLVIGVIGADDVFNELGTVLSGRTINGRAVTRQRLAEGDSLAGTQLLFVGRGIDLMHSSLVKTAKTSPVLLVSDTSDGLNQGAIFNFVTGDRVRFEVSLDAAEHAGIRVSSRILTVSERVTGGH